MPRLASLLLLLAALACSWAQAQWTETSVVALEGKFVTLEAPGSDGEVVEGVLVIRDGRIEALLPKGADAPAGALRVKTSGYVYPGLINLHGHVNYDFLSLYPLPEHAENSHDWPQGDAYLREVNNPRVAVTHSKFFNYMDEALKYAEVRAIVGGMTAIQGAPNNSAIKDTLVRNVDQKTFGKDDVGQSALTMNVRMAEGLEQDVPKIKELTAWIMHLAEGIDDYARSQWSDPSFDPAKPFDELPTSRNLPGLVEADLVFPGLVGVHCTGLHKEDFEQWRQITGEGPKVVWSPASNLLLYGKTTPIGDVLASDGLDRPRYGLGPRGPRTPLWGAQGRGAGSTASSRTLVHRPAARRAGHRQPRQDPGLGGARWPIRVGLAADLLVLDAIDPDPTATRSAPREEHVQLVFVGGNPLYGDEAQPRAQDLRGLRYELLAESWPPQGDRHAAGPQGPQRRPQLRRGRGPLEDGAQPRSPGSGRPLQRRNEDQDLHR
ncbi:MAG: hypothetical protein R3F62_20685 [Planctomycetota bacterium]